MRPFTSPRLACTALVVLSALSIVVSAQSPLGTAFTYQGQIKSDGVAASGLYDLEFRMFDAPVGGVAIGPTLTFNDISLTAGLFTAKLDFGAGAFSGNGAFLEIGIRPGESSGAYTLLGSRQELTPAPHSLFASRAGTATTLNGLACSTNEIVKWSGGQWSCAADEDSAPTASAPLAVSAGNVSLAACAASQIYKMVGGAWLCSTDLNTTYAAGPGITLTSNVLATDDALVARKDAAAGNQAFDATTLFLDYTNNRVGIGNASPLGTLDVQGGTAASDVAGAGILLTAQNGGPDGVDGNSSGGAGGMIRLVAGAGGTAQQGGIIRLDGAIGGAATASLNGFEGSDVAITAGAGGPSAFAAEPAGSGGDLSMRAGNGGSNSVGGQSGDGGTVSLNAGNGFSGGTLTLAGGNGNFAGGGGEVSIGGGSGGLGGGAGGGVAIRGGISSAGAAGEITLTPGTTTTGTIGSIQLGGTTAQANSTAAGPVVAHIVGGDLSFTGPGDGIILRSPNGTVCRLLSINDSGSLVVSAVACP